MRLEYSENEKREKLNTVAEIVCAIILGCACFFVFTSMFGLKYSAGTMTGGGFSQGIARIWDNIADTLGNLNYTILPKYKAGANEAKSYGFALTVILAMMSVISYLIIKSRVKLMLAAPIIPLVIMIARFGVKPSVYAGAALAGALVLALALMNIKGKISPAYFAVPLAAVLVGAGIVFALDKTVSLDEPKSLSEKASDIRASLEEMRYGRDVLPEGNVGAVSGKELKEERGSIDSIKLELNEISMPGSYGTEEEESEEEDEENNAETALTVKMSQPESYYLRGFVGAEYSKNRWNTLPAATFYNMRDKIFWLNRRGFDGLSEMAYTQELSSASTGYAQPLFGTGETGTTTDTSAVTPAAASENVKLEVKVKDASKKIAFTPYELVLKPATGKKARKSEMKLPKGTKNYGGSYLGTEGYSGKSEYKYTAAPNITGSWTDAVGEFYTTTATEEINNFFISESHYNVDVYNRYLDIPDNLVSIIESEIGSPGDISEEHADYKDTIETISSYLAGKYIYSDTFKKVKKDSDFVESFVASKQGCDIHFATLAALMFRYYGIPARYVEGYLVTPSQVEGAADAVEVNVSKAANHAWTEIYIDGFGWVPFEATPDYRGIMKESDMTRGLQNVNYETPQNNNLDDEEDEPEQEENEETDDLAKLMVRLLVILAIALVSILLLILLVWLARKVIRWMNWQRSFKDKDPKKGIRALYQYSAENKWTLSEKGEDLGLTASYSQLAMEESDREVMKKEVDAAKEKAKAEQAAEKKRLQEEKVAARKREQEEKEAAKKKAKMEKEADAKAKEAAAKAKAEYLANPYAEHVTVEKENENHEVK